MAPLACGRNAFNAHRNSRTILAICSAVALSQLYLASAGAQENEYPAMEPPPDYVEQQHERERSACIVTGACDQPVRPGAPANPDKWTALPMSDTTKRFASSHGADLKQAAVQQALTYCRSTGSLDCKLLQWAGNRCLALTGSSDGASGWDVGPNRAQAALNSLAQCRGRGGKYCVVDTAPCADDDPPWPSLITTSPRGTGTRRRVE
jgi:hypothetical protein